MIETRRAVWLTYKRDGATRRGSGLLIGGRLVLTADHCANGSKHRVFVDGVLYKAKVHTRSDDPGVDLALLEVVDLDHMPTLPVGRVDREHAHSIRECMALGLPKWKDGSDGVPRLAQVHGDVPTAEGVAPTTGARAHAPLALKITNQWIARRPVPTGALDHVESEWAGMSGAVVVTPDGTVVGVVSAHNLAEGSQSLAVTPISAIANLQPDVQGRFCDAFRLGSVSELPVLEEAPRSDRLVECLQRVNDLAQAGHLRRNAQTRLQVLLVLQEFEDGPQ